MVTVSFHEKCLRQLPCAVSSMTPVTLHHCHGGSLKDAGWHVGVGQRQNPYLQIPLHHQYHVGQFGIDAGMGVLTWEETFGSQYAALETTDDKLIVLHGYQISIFEMALRWDRENRDKVIKLHAE